MRTLSILATCLTLLAWDTFHVSVEAQEFLPPASDEHRVDTLFDAPDPSEHAGLLGKVYMQQRYVQQSIDDSIIRQLDDSWQGFDSQINLPVMTLDGPISLDFDAFLSYANVGLKGAASTGPPLNITAILNAKNEVYTLGTTIYPTYSDKLRPFVQIGAQFSRLDADVVIRDPVETIADHVVDHETDLLLNGGFEYDLLGALGYRMTFHAETSDRFQDSVVTNELILWPHERIFVRGGVATSLESGRLGYAIGGGLAF